MCYREDDYSKPLSGEEWRDIFQGVILVLFMVAAVIAVGIIHHPAVGK